MAEKQQEVVPTHIESSSFKGTGPEEDVEEPTLHWRTWAVVFSCGLVLFADNFGVVATGFWLREIIGDLGQPLIVIWFAESFIVLQSALMPILGLWMDFGSQTRRWMTFVNAMLAGMGLIIAGSAKTMQVGIIGTCFFGFSVVNYALCFAIVSEVVPHRMRGLGQAIVYVLTAAGALVGSLAQGQIVKDNLGGQGGWRWNLYFSAIFHFIAAGAILLLYRPLPEKVPHPDSYLTRLRKLDWVGSGLFGAGWILFLVGLTIGGNLNEWVRTDVLVPTCIGAAILILFGLHQVFLKKDGVLNHRLFTHKNFVLACLGIMTEGAYLIPLNTFNGQMVGILYETDPVHAGLHGAVYWVGSIVSAGIAGWYSKKYRRVTEWIILGWLCILFSLVGMTQCKVGDKWNRVSYGMSALGGFGVGIELSLLIATAQLAVPADLIGICSALFTGIRSIGACISITIAQAVYTARLNVNLPNAIASAASGAGVPAAEVSAVVTAVATSDTAALASLGLSSEQQQAALGGLLNGYAASFPYIWYVIMSFPAAMAIASFFFGPVKQFMTWQIDHPVEADDALGIHRQEPSTTA